MLIIGIYQLKLLLGHPWIPIKLMLQYRALYVRIRALADGFVCVIAASPCTRLAVF
jgi:hypothetical protein